MSVNVLMSSVGDRGREAGRDFKSLFIKAQWTRKSPIVICVSSNVHHYSAAHMCSEEHRQSEWVTAYPLVVESTQIFSELQ